MIPLVSLTKQYESIKPEIDEAIARVISSGQYILGREVQTFEEELAEYLEVKFCVGVASGTDALYLALKALDVGEDDRVITTPFTFIATAESIVRCGATPVFVDVDAWGNINLSLIEKRIAQNSNLHIKAILPVHLYGNPVNMERLMSIAAKHGIYVVEDCAQSIGASWGNKSVGAWGDVGCFSFFPSKNLGCAGDGGMVATNDEQVASLIKKLRNHGASTHYMYEEHGLNSRLDEIQAAILRVKLKHLNEGIKKRRELAYLYDSYLSGVVTLPLEVKGHAQNYYTIQVHDRDELRQYLAESGISTAVYYPLPLHLQKVYAYLGYKKGDCPIAEALSERVLSLPMYPELSEEDLMFICRKVKEFYDKN